MEGCEPAACLVTGRWFFILPCKLFLMVKETLLLAGMYLRPVWAYNADIP